MAGRTLIRLAASVLAAAATLAGGAAPAAELAPAGEWQVRQDEEYCELSRQFGSGSDAVTAFVYSYGAMGLLRMSLVGDRIPRDDSGAAMVDPRFDGAENPWPLVGIISRRGDQGMVTFQITGPGIRFNSFLKGRWQGRVVPALVMPGNASSVTVNAGGMEQLTLQMGAMSQPLAQLQDCGLRLGENWGFAAEDERQIAQRATLTNPVQLRDRIAYPNAARINRTSTILQMRMRVTADGRAEDCVVQAPDWNSRFKRDACEAAERFGEFEPARDASGAAVPSLMRFSYLMVIFD